MKWTKANIETYIETKEFIDTLLIPLIKLDLKSDQRMKDSALGREYINVLAYELERRLAGRTMLLPDYVYLSNAQYNAEVNRINEWIQSFSEQSFTNIFFISLDNEWTKFNQELQGQFLWLSHVPFDNLSEQTAKTFIQTQADKLSETIQSFWS